MTEHNSKHKPLNNNFTVDHSLNIYYVKTHGEVQLIAVSACFQHICTAAAPRRHTAEIFYSARSIKRLHLQR